MITAKTHNPPLVSSTLKLDFDGPIPPELRERLGFAAAHLRLKVVGLSRKKSAGGRGWHVRAELSRALPVQAVVALQAILGSDARREVFNLSRALVLSDAPAFWQSRWNVLYLSKLGDSSMLDIQKYAVGNDRQHVTLKAEHVDAPFAVLTISNVREITVTRPGEKKKDAARDEPALVLEFEELPGFAYFANFSGIKKLIHGLGVEEREWFGKRVVLEKRTAKNPETGADVEVLWIADSRTWADHFKAAGKPKRGRGGRKSVRARVSSAASVPVAPAKGKRGAAKKRNR